MNPSTPVFAILASGRGSNCRALLEAARSGRLPGSCGAVITDRKNAPVLAVAQEFGVEGLFLDPGKPGARFTEAGESEYVAALRSRRVEWVALAGFMRILGPGLLSAYPNRILNIHPSLLPAFPGLDAQGQAFRAGVKVAGCTVHFVDAGVDTGAIVAQSTVPVHDDDTEESLKARILEIEHETYVQAFGWALRGELNISDGRVRRALKG